MLWVKSKAAEEHKFVLLAKISVSRLVSAVTEILLDCVLWLTFWPVLVRSRYFKLVCASNPEDQPSRGLFFWEIYSRLDIYW